MPMPLLKGVGVFFPRTFELNQENNMTTKDNVARRKLSLLELAQEMSNVSKACRALSQTQLRHGLRPTEHTVRQWCRRQCATP